MQDSDVPFGATRTADQDLFRRLLDGSDLLVSCLAPDGTIRWASAAHRRLGWDPDELVGRPVVDLLDPEDGEQFASSLQLLTYSGEDSVHVHQRMATPVGGPFSRLWTEARVLVVRDGGGAVAEIHVYATDISEQISAHQALVESEERYRLLAVNATDLVMRTQADGAIAYISPSVRAILGYPPRDLLGYAAWDLVHPDDRELTVAALAEVVERSATEDARLRFRARHADGHYLWLESVSRAIADPITGSVVEVQTSCRSIDDQVAAERDLRHSEQRFRLALTSSPLAMVLADPQHRVVMANRSAVSFLGRPTLELLGSDWRTWVHESDSAVVAGMLEGRRPSAPVTLRFPSGGDGVLWGRLVLVALSGDDAEEPGFLIQIQDVTEEQHRAELLEHRSRRDGPTGLPNRTAAVAALERHLRSDAPGDGVTVLKIRVGKVVDHGTTTDRVGIDLVLAAVAERIESHPIDLVARVDTDLLAVVCPHLSDQEEAERLASRLVSALSGDLSIGTLTVRVEIGIGVTTAPRGAFAGEVLHNARMAATAALAAGPEPAWEWYDQAQHPDTFEHLDTDKLLRGALAEDWLRLHYQPVVDLVRRTVVGYEALVRIEHPLDGVIEPASFLGRAEQTELILPLGRWVLREAVRTTARRWAAGDRTWVAVNVSATQLTHDDVVGVLAEALERHDLPAEAVHIEVTESTLLLPEGMGLAEVGRLDAMGCRISLDDFGTGFSSLTYLRALPVSTLKLDRSFVREVGQEQESTTIVSAILSLASGLGLDVIAEGVETEQQATVLASMGCSRGQGYLFGQPRPVA